MQPRSRTRPVTRHRWQDRRGSALAHVLSKERALLKALALVVKVIDRVDSGGPSW
jgi:hypothetical protein